MGAGRADGRRAVALSTTPSARWLWLVPRDSARTPADWALLPLRAFLGFTFCFAGLQKLANPAFFDATNPASIQAQMAGAARRSPIHVLISPLAHHAALIGGVIALGEVAVGVGALFGILTRIAAVGGVLLSLNLFLAVSFHTSPYYTGSDIVFVFAWMPFIVAGGGLFSLDALVTNVVAARQSWSGAPVDIDRRRVLGAVTLAAAGVAVVGTGAVAGLGRLFHSASSARASDELTPTAAPPTAPAAKPAGTKIGPASGVPVAGSAAFQDPASGDPAIVVQPNAGTFLGFDAVCPHAGCTVAYDQGNARFVCPCHGSQFNGTTGAVEVGPATDGLGRIAVAKGADGQLYAQ